MPAIAFLPFLLALLACVAGAARAERKWPDWLAIAGVLLFTLAAGIFVSTWRDEDVAADSVIFGTILGALLMATGPLFIYFALGRALSGHPILLTLVSLASMVPLGYYLIIAVLLTADIVSCPPDAYECPV